MGAGGERNPNDGGGATSGVLPGRIHYRWRKACSLQTPSRLQESIFKQVLAMQDVLIPGLIRMQNLFFWPRT